MADRASTGPDDASRGGDTEPSTAPAGAPTAEPTDRPLQLDPVAARAWVVRMIAARAADRFRRRNGVGEGGSPPSSGLRTPTQDPPG